MTTAMTEELLEQLADKVAARILIQIGGSSSTDDVLAFDEEEAARRLSIHRHQLRDERQRGNIKASVITGKRIRYTIEDLKTYLSSRRYESIAPKKTSRTPRP